MTKHPALPLIGAHVSIAGGVHHALEEGQSIGATTIQIFTANQKRWETKPIPEEEVTLWKAKRAETQIESIMSHGSYLINLGSCKEELLNKSLKAFENELNRCHQLDLSFLNFHPGAYTEGSEEACLETIVHSLLSMRKLTEKGSTRLLIETTAGQGTCVGHRFEQIGFLISRLHREIPIGVCLDTCHVFAAGYPIRTRSEWDFTLKQFDQEIGLSHLYALHLNDSMKPLNSHKDRHANLGEGEIGMECFQVLMTHPKLQALPKY